MKTILTRAVFAFGLSASLAQAATFDYDFTFTMDALDLAGQEATVRVTLDNGNATNINQSYTLNQVIAGRVLTLDGAPFFDQSLLPQTEVAGTNTTARTFITTDATGAAQIDFLDSGGHAYVNFGTLPDLAFYLGMSGGVGGLPEFGLRFANPARPDGREDGLLTNVSIKQTAGTFVPAAPVPLPAGGVLILSGLLGLGALRKLRKAACTQTDGAPCP